MVNNKETCLTNYIGFKLSLLIIHVVVELVWCLFELSVRESCVRILSDHERLVMIHLPKLMGMYYCVYNQLFCGER